MKEQLKSIDERAKEELSHIDDAKLLEDFRVRFLGKKGEITSILKQMGKLSAEERPVIGQLANKVRADIENALNKRKEELKSKMEQVRLTEEAIDVTLPGKKTRIGRPHPLNATLEEVEEVFLGMGFDIVDVVSAHCYSFKTDTKCKSAVNLRVNATALKYLRVYHTCAEKLYPALLLAH